MRVCARLPVRWGGSGGGETACTRVLLRVWVCDPLREKAGPATPLGSLVQQLVSFIHAFFVHEHFFHECRVPGPSLGGGPSSGLGTHPLLPWRNSQSRQEADPAKQKAIPGRKWMWRKRHWVWLKRCGWEFQPGQTAQLPRDPSV